MSVDDLAKFSSGGIEIRLIIGGYICRNNYFSKYMKKSYNLRGAFFYINFFLWALPCAI
jgi:hypothetical protein